MLSFFRRITRSKLGGIVAFLVLGIIAIAFAASDITGLNTGGGGIVGGDVARVGKAEVTAADLRARVQSTIDQARQQQPTLDVAQFIAQGGLEATLDREIAGLALEQFGLAQGMAVSKRSIDGQLASIPALQGPNGKFDPTAYARLLAERRLTDAQVRRDIARDTIAQNLIAPTQGAAQVPVSVALPYASLFLERRAGQIALIPSSAVTTGPAPTDADVQSWYTRNIARYTLPERRIVRYALVTPASITAQPTDAEIAAAYAADRAKYAPTEKRTITQVVIADQAGAQALAAKVRGGTDIAEAARAVGLEASTQTGVDRTAYARAASSALADAAFSATQGAVVGPLRGPLGWTVARVTKVEQVAGRTLAQARDEIVNALKARKTTEGLADVQNAVDEAVSKNATFDEVVADRKLTPLTTPALTATGLDPLDPNKPANPALAPVVAAAFQAQDGDPPSLVSTGPDGSFAVVAIGRVVSSAPRPLAQVRDAVIKDLTADRARQAARRVANDILARVRRGATLAQAIAQAGVSLPPVRQVATSRLEVAQNPRGAEPALALMFSMAQGGTKTLEAAGNAGWYVVHLDRIQPGDARGSPAILAGTRADLRRAVGREYVEQFARAVRNAAGVKTDASALAKLRGDLLGQSGN
jgi:peptidyl-prolyl cis-trans isomerase D